MKSIIVLLTVVCMIILLSGSVFAGMDPVKTVTTGCEKELETYCKNVTMGEGRILACLYAHSDKLSGRCEYALYDAAAQLERFVAALSFVVNECEDDLEKYCGSVQAGEGRLAECLLVKNKASISARCSQALEDVDLKYQE